MKNAAQGINLTGVWHGLYSYGVPGEPAVPFVATMMDVAGNLSGTTHETSIRQNAGEMTLFAEIDGDRAGKAVQFLKVYNSDDPDFGQVHYQGEVSQDATEIEGRWTIGGRWSGKFLMIRNRGNEAENTAQRFAEVE